MTSVLAPVLPHLAEEIHSSWTGDRTSVFMTKWTPLVRRDPLVFVNQGLYLPHRIRVGWIHKPQERCLSSFGSVEQSWHYWKMQEQISKSHTVTFVPLSLTLSFRRVKSSLEAEVDLILPDGGAGSSLAELLQREGWQPLFG